MGKPDEIKPTLLRLPLNIYRELKIEAARRGVSISAVAADVLAKFFTRKAA